MLSPNSSDPSINPGFFIDADRACETFDIDAETLFEMIDRKAVRHRELDGRLLVEWGDALLATAITSMIAETGARVPTP